MTKALQMILNAGSSSIKYAFFRPTIVAGSQTWNCVIQGVAEGIATTTQSRIKHEVDGKKETHKVALADHRTAISSILDLLPKGTIENIASVGHRVVHGGEDFNKAAKIDDEVMGAIKKASPLAPLHNPWHILGIEVCEEVLGKHTPQVAVFDTAFHQTMPPHAFMYALPYEMYTKHAIRKYGFHGTSYFYVTGETARVLGKPVEELNIIACHLGNGSSMCAVQGGKSIDTTMGLTPLEGLVMGTRCGDIDPAVVFYLMDNLGYTAKDVNDLFNKKSGLIGICGTMDDRDVEERYFSKEHLGTLAKEVQIHRLRKYLGAYMVALGGKVDAIVFTGGLGEKGWLLRSLVCKDLEELGIVIDETRNQAKEGRFDANTRVHADGSKIQVWVIPTQEELSIAEQSYDVLNER